MSDIKGYILNPESGRYIVHGGTLHRKLIKTGKLPPVMFEQRNPVIAKGSRASYTARKKTAENRIKEQEAVENIINNGANPEEELKKIYPKLTPKKVSNTKPVLVEKNIEHYDYNDISKNDFLNYLSKNIRKEDGYNQELIDEITKQIKAIN